MDLSGDDSDATVLEDDEEVLNQRESVDSIARQDQDLSNSSPCFLKLVCVPMAPGPHETAVSQVVGQQKQTVETTTSQITEHVLESPGVSTNSQLPASILHDSLKTLIDRRCVGEPLNNGRETTVDCEMDTHNRHIDMASEDDAMSQEFPPLTNTVAGNENSVSSTDEKLVTATRVHTLVHHVPQRVSIAEPTLESITQEQDVLLKELREFAKFRYTVATTELLEKSKNKAAIIETSLKAISIANQSERKKLAEAHSSLSQQTNSQQEFLTESHFLKQQLLKLASKQKLLLECYSKQKEIGTHFSHLSSLKLQKGGSQLDDVTSEEPLNKQQALTSSVASSDSVLSSQRHPIALPPSSSTKSNQPLSSVKNSLPSKLPSTDLAHPVPLETLIDHGFIVPEVDCLSCLILGCEFRSSLLKDGTIKEQDNIKDTTIHQLPHQWVRSCWAKLGHPQKKPSRKVAYSCVLYKDTPLINYCERYSLKQVSSYLKLKSGGDSRKPEDLNNKYTSSGIANPAHADVVADQTVTVTRSAASSAIKLAPPLAPIVTEAHARHSHKFNLGQLLTDCSVFLVKPVSKRCPTSLKLPQEFWKTRDILLTPQLVEQIELDMEW